MPIEIIIYLIVTVFGLTTLVAVAFIKTVLFYKDPHNNLLSADDIKLCVWVSLFWPLAILAVVVYSISFGFIWLWNQTAKYIASKI